MGETLGYTLSAIVVGAIALIISSLTFRGQEATVATIQYSSAKQSTMDLIAVMDRDFRNMGSNFPYPNILSDGSVINYDTVSTPHRFDFTAQTTPGALPDTISYRWQAGSPFTSDGITYSTVTVQRYVNSVLTGGNSGVITSLSIELYTGTGDPVMDGADTRQIQVEMRMISSLGANGDIKESRWSETFHPMHMAKQDGLYSS